MEEVCFVKYCCYFKGHPAKPHQSDCRLSMWSLSVHYTTVKGDVKTLNSSPKMHREEPLNNRMCVLLKSKE